MKIVQNIKMEKKMSQKKIRKFKFIESVSENNDHAHLIEKIMFLENTIERLYRGAAKYEYRHDISILFRNFCEVKINNIKIATTDAMRLEIFKVRKQLIKLLEEYISNLKKVVSPILGGLSIDKGYFQILYPYREYKKLSEKDLVDYVNNSQPIKLLNEDIFYNDENKLSALDEQRLKHKKTRSKFAINGV